jgi:L-amino acid N-acyltransferase YncA
VTAWHESFRDLLPAIAFEAITIPIRMERWRERLEQSPSLPIYVAERDNEIVGFADGGPARPNEALGQEMQIYAVYLVSRAKRQGIGTRLLQRVVHDFLAQGRSSACVWTLRDASPARHFYESLGAQLAAEKIEHRPAYDREIVGYVWPDLRRSFPGCGT